MRHAQHHAKPDLTCLQAKNQLLTMLYNATPERLAGFEVANLARMYKLSGNHVTNERLIEYELTIVRQRRVTKTTTERTEHV